MCILVIYFVIPLVAMVYLNVRILYVLRHERMGSVDCLRDNNNNKATRKNTRTMRVLVAIIVAFTLLTFPNRIILVFFTYKSYMEEPIPDDAYTIISFVALVPYSFHIAINPLLYCIIDKSWRKQAVQLLSCGGVLWGTEGGWGRKGDRVRNSMNDDSHLHSHEATCVKSASFLSEHHRPSYINNNNRAGPYMGMGGRGDREKGALLPLPITAEVSMYSSRDASDDDDVGNLHNKNLNSSSLLEPSTDASPKRFYVYKNHSMEEEEEERSEGVSTTSDNIQGEPINDLETLLPDPNRETIL